MSEFSLDEKYSPDNVIWELTKRQNGRDPEWKGSPVFENLSSMKENKVKKVTVCVTVRISSKNDSKIK